MMSREMKIGIIGGVISSVLVIIFIQPILSWLWGVLITFGEWAHAGYIDEIYRRAAIGDLIGKAGVLTLLLLLASMMFSLLFSLTSHRELRTRQSGGEVHSDWKILRKVEAITVFIPFILIIFLGMFSVSILMGVSIISSSFEQRLIILSPSISDQEYKIWKARWASMQNINDYRSIQKDLDKRAVELKVSLPKQKEP